MKLNSPKKTRDVLVDPQPHQVVEGQRVLYVAGRAQTMLAAERTALNVLKHLSSIATATRAYVERLRGTAAVVCETRKTTPVLRELEKYAVRRGGGRRCHPARQHEPGDGTGGDRRGGRPGDRGSVRRPHAGNPGRLRRRRRPGDLLQRHHRRGAPADLGLDFLGRR